MRTRIAFKKKYNRTHPFTLSWRTPLRCSVYTEGCGGGYPYLVYKHFSEVGVPAIETQNAGCDASRYVRSVLTRNFDRVAQVPNSGSLLRFLLRYGERLGDEAIVKLLLLNWSLFEEQRQLQGHVLPATAYNLTVREWTANVRRKIATEVARLGGGVLENGKTLVQEKKRRRSSASSLLLLQEQNKDSKANGASQDHKFFGRLQRPRFFSGRKAWRKLHKRFHELEDEIEPTSFLQEPTSNAYMGVFSDHWHEMLPHNVTNDRLQQIENTIREILSEPDPLGREQLSRPCDSRRCFGSRSRDEVDVASLLGITEVDAAGRRRAADSAQDGSGTGAASGGEAASGSGSGNGVGTNEQDASDREGATGTGGAGSTGEEAGLDGEQGGAGNTTSEEDASEDGEGDATTEDRSDLGGQGTSGGELSSGGAEVTSARATFRIGEDQKTTQRATFEMTAPNSHEKLAVNVSDGSGWAKFPCTSLHCAGMKMKETLEENEKSTRPTVSISLPAKRRAEEGEGEGDTSSQTNDELSLLSLLARRTGAHGRRRTPPATPPPPQFPHHHSNTRHLVDTDDAVVGDVQTLLVYADYYGYVGGHAQGATDELIMQHIFLDGPVVMSLNADGIRHFSLLSAKEARENVLEFYDGLEGGVGSKSSWGVAREQLSLLEIANTDGARTSGARNALREDELDESESNVMLSAAVRPQSGRFLEEPLPNNIEIKTPWTAVTHTVICVGWGETAADGDSASAAQGGGYERDPFAPQTVKVVSPDHAGRTIVKAGRVVHVRYADDDDNSLETGGAGAARLVNDGRKTTLHTVDDMLEAEDILDNSERGAMDFSSQEDDVHDSFALMLFQKGRKGRRRQTTAASRTSTGAAAGNSDTQGRRGNKKFWQIRNSYGRYWGDRGYAKLIRGEENPHKEYVVEYATVDLRRLDTAVQNGFFGGPLESVNLVELSAEQLQGERTDGDDRVGRTHAPSGAEINDELLDDLTAETFGDRLRSHISGKKIYPGVYGSYRRHRRARAMEKIDEHGSYDRKAAHAHARVAGIFHRNADRALNDRIIDDIVDQLDDESLGSQHLHTGLRSQNEVWIKEESEKLIGDVDEHSSLYKEPRGEDEVEASLDEDDLDLPFVVGDAEKDETVNEEENGGEVVEVEQGAEETGTGASEGGGADAEQPGASEINETAVLPTGQEQGEANTGCAARKNLASLGICFGKFTHSGKFHLQVTCLDFLARLALYKVWLKPGGEQHYLYGNHVVKAHLRRITEDVPRNAGVVIFSEQGDLPIGFGTAARSTAECREAPTEAIVVYHQSDIGEYLREESNLL
eukprot:g707.t1